MGLGLVPENRISQGIILIAPVRNNITLPFVSRLARGRAGIINGREERKIARQYIAALKLKTPDENTSVGSLSGGNQQKVSIAKWLATRSDLIIFDEPTHGIDVGAKADIYQLLRELSDEGKGDHPGVLGAAGGAQRLRQDPGFPGREDRARVRRDQGAERRRRRRYALG